MRTVAHLDMDCFYAQVESLRLKLHPSVPLVVQQWKNVIAVNYPSRKYGIKRGMAAAECKRLCPQVVCAQVELIEHEYSTGGENSALPSSPTPVLAPRVEPVSHQQTSASTGVVKKVSLERYRVASEQIMAIIYAMNPHCEQGGIDEIFLEIDTSSVVGTDGEPITSVADFHREILHMHSSGAAAATIVGAAGLPQDSASAESAVGDPAAAPDLPDPAELLGTWDGSALEPGDPFTPCLLAAALHVYRIRKAVLDETGYVVSAGIAGNKMLAKQASAARKPNRQTLVPLANVDAMMRETRVKDLRGLGGKLGQQVVEATGAKCAFELQSIALPALCARFGEKTGRWVHSACRGIDDEPVSAAGATGDGSNLNDSMMKKSIAASKSFSLNLADRAALIPWLTVLCTDIHARLQQEDAKFRRRARSISIFHRGPTASLSRTSKLPSLESRVPTVDVLVQSALRLVENRIPVPYPINGISVSAGDFVILQRGNLADMFGTASSHAGSSSSGLSPTAAVSGESPSFAARHCSLSVALEPHAVVPQARSPVGILRFCSKGAAAALPSAAAAGSVAVASPPEAAPQAATEASVSVRQDELSGGASCAVVKPAEGPVTVEAAVGGVCDSDLEVARRLQESFDREELAISTSFDKYKVQHSKKRKASAASISQFFGRR